MIDKILAGIILIVIVAFIWISVAGPCWLYSFAANKDVPARCVSTFTK